MVADSGSPRARRHLAAPSEARGGPSTVVAPSPRLRASWQRSEDYGVPFDEVEPSFSGTIDRESLFFVCGQEVLSGLARTLAGEPVSLMLTDSDGLVLDRLSGDHALLRSLDAVHLAPGFSYAERTVGTNGLGLALADRVPTVVRAEEHYALNLCTYTCAAVPVLDPWTGRVEGCVNLTTRSPESPHLLLALAQSAAGNTAALMLARSQGKHAHPAPRGEVFRVEAPRLEPGAGTLGDLGRAWREASSVAEAALRAGQVVIALGDEGSGRTTLLAQAMRRVFPRERLLAASPPAPEDCHAWLGLWGPELGKPDTGVVARDVDRLPAWVAAQVRELVDTARGRTAATVPVGLTASRFEAVPPALAGLATTVVGVPPLHERAEDVVPIARHVALGVRGREVAFTPSAERALHDCPWPGGVRQLRDVVRKAASSADVVDVRHLPPEVLSATTRRLSRLEAFEREEIVRLLSSGLSVQRTADELGIGRATVYRKMALYDIRVPRSRGSEISAT